jgi:chorismate-pyruvate lyase
MEFKEEEVVFKDNSGHERKMVATEVLLIIKGRINIQAETEITETKIRWGATLMLMASGIPIIRTVKEKISDRSGQTEYFARLYAKESPEQSVEIPQLHMNYSFLGAKMTPSSVTNFNTVLMRLREVFTQAIFDDRLEKIPDMDVSPEKSRSNLEINCKLLYLYYLAIK